jgi:hypothetical protein
MPRYVSHGIVGELREMTYEVHGVASGSMPVW